MTQNGVSGDTVDIDKGSAWNNAYINQIETKYVGVKVTKLSMSTVSTQCGETATKGTTRATGFQAPHIVKLFASSAGLSGSIRQNLKKSFGVTRTVELYNTQRYPEFDVRFKGEDRAQVC